MAVPATFSATVHPVATTPGATDTDATTTTVTVNTTDADTTSGHSKGDGVFPDSQSTTAAREEACSPSHVEKDGGGVKTPGVKTIKDGKW